MNCKLFINKICYTEQEAKIKAGKRMARTWKKCYVYKCPNGNHYHLTHLSPKEYKKLSTITYLTER